MTPLSPGEAGWQWLRRIFHRHEWQHLETHRLLPYKGPPGPIVVHFGGRDFHYRECVECGKWQQYYPSDAQKAAIPPEKIFIDHYYGDPRAPSEPLERK